MKYRKKPVVIEAMQLTDATACAVRDFCNGILFNQDPLPVWINVKTLEGTMRADLGDYIIKGVKGEFYPCKPDIFEMTYEKVE